MNVGAFYGKDGRMLIKVVEGVHRECRSAMKTVTICSFQNCSGVLPTDGKVLHWYSKSNRFSKVDEDRGGV